MRPLCARWLIEVGDCGWTGERQAADERGDGGNGPWQTAADLPPARLFYLHGTGPAQILKDNISPLLLNFDMIIWHY